MSDCCPSFAAGYGVHYSNCPNHDPVEDVAQLPAAEAELERRTTSAATTEGGVVLTLELRALKILGGLKPNARLAAANWLLALNEEDAREQEKRELRNARRRAARRKVAA